MKYKVVALVFFFLVGTFYPLVSKNREVVISDYVVIGAFAFYKNATRFTIQTNHDKLKLTATYELNEDRNLYYVYVLSTQDHEEALRLANKLRTETKFADAWVYHGVLGKQTNNQGTPYKGNDINPATNTNIKTIEPADFSARKGPRNNNTPIEIPMAENEVQPINASAEDEKKNFVFKLYRGVDNSEVQGEIEEIDVDRSRRIATYEGNIPVKVSSPRSNSGEIALVCKVFGYRKVQQTLNFNQPASDNVSLIDDSTLMVPFELVRLQKGDIAVMYNVYFFNDAGIMRPESRFEINNLLEMMKENPKYAIRIHGHTNGSAVGKILSVGDSKDFFSLTGAKENLGSSKELSEERAKVVKEYLVANGIDPKRMQIKAWGGKVPIYDKNGPRAKENVRVEVEILDN